MSGEGKLAGRSVHVSVVDGGSGANVISNAWARDNGAPLLKFTFGNGSVAMSTQLVRQVVQVGEWEGMVTMRVCPRLMDGVQVILGRPWLRVVNPVVDWAAGSIVCPGEKLMMRVRPAGSEASRAQGPPVHKVLVGVIGAAAMRKELKKEDSVDMQAVWGDCCGSSRTSRVGGADWLRGAVYIREGLGASGATGVCGCVP